MRWFDVIRSFLQGQNWGRAPCNSQGFVLGLIILMARVLSLTGARIRELDIESDDNMDRDPQGVSGAVFQGMSYMDLSHCCDAFHGIRKVTMIVDGDCIGGWMTGNLVKILSGATNLEKMCFSGTRISPVS